MTNPPNEFAQQLDQLFAALEIVLQNNLANKVTKEELNEVNTSIKKIETKIQKDLQDIDKRVQALEELFKNSQNHIPQSSVNRPAIASVIPAPQPQPVKTTDTTNPTSTNEFGHNHDVVKISGDMIAGRKNPKNKQFTRPKFAQIDTHELIRQITSSQYYNESVLSTPTFIINIIDSINDDNAVVTAIQTCILIDLHNMALIEHIDYKWYEKFIKEPNVSTVRDLQVLLQQYGLQDEILTFLNIQAAIEGMIYFSPEQLQTRIKGSNKKLEDTLREFITRMNRTINNRTQFTKPTDAVRTNSQPEGSDLSSTNQMPNQGS